MGEIHLDVESMARFFILQEVMDNPTAFTVASIS